MMDKVYVAMYCFGCDDPIATNDVVVGVYASLNGAIDGLRNFHVPNSYVAGRDKALDALAANGPGYYGFDRKGNLYKGTLAYGTDGVYVLVKDLLP